MARQKKSWVDSGSGSLLKLVKPLDGSRLTSIEIRAEYHHEAISQELTIQDREALLRHRAAFTGEQTSLETEELAMLPQVRDGEQLSEALRTGSPDILFVGSINELNKATNEGELLLDDGMVLPFRIVGPNPERPLYRLFAARGPSGVVGRPRFQESSLSGVDVVDLVPLS